VDSVAVQEACALQKKRHLHIFKVDKIGAAVVLHRIVTPGHAGHVNRFELQEMLVRELLQYPALALEGSPHF
jgi:hypothetical protein